MKRLLSTILLAGSLAPLMGLEIWPVGLDKVGNSPNMEWSDSDGMTLKVMNSDEGKQVMNVLKLKAEDLLIADIIAVSEISRVCDGDKAQAHDQGQHQRENLFQVSHGWIFLLLNSAIKFDFLPYFVKNVDFYIRKIH